ncbi:hypothetical protein [Sodalinema gerasimenkoae]|nr:hypothetical protein [Sodalinema gerasimenkoae]
MPIVLALVIVHCDGNEGNGLGAIGWWGLAFGLMACGLNPWLENGIF